MFDLINEIDWFCDSCSAYMNDQLDFEENTGTWTCSECGFQNDVSENNVNYDSVSGDDGGEMTPTDSSKDTYMFSSFGGDSCDTAYCCGMIYEDGEAFCSSCGDPLY